MEVKRNTVEFLVKGDRALFADPVTRVGGEKTSYYVPTYEALKGILASVYWKPTLVWIIDSVRVMNMIQTASEGVRTRNYDGGNDLSVYTYLKDVCYQVRAHFIWNENRPELAADRNEHKHHNVARRMIERGGRRDIFLGTRECQGTVEACIFGEGAGIYDQVEELHLGYMFHGFTYADEALRKAEKGHMSVRFHHVVMKRGVIEFPGPEEIPDQDRRILHKMPVKPFGEAIGNFSGLAEFAGEEVTE
ncbi:type I-C CRISPR-associated protein Cas5c [Desulfosporosinus sp. BICA1-9]|uniref:type I-C CRISPR-associated protein Cas5c n=1 Tax=Desulfosporosinus sp. BICA1-9 TaxID=1531958 RepID=UPI00054C6FDC|nr:type I-C CRISPR-associated protein Cas5c [Desulfosporosinus sp. BICA1-9]KJS49057.1 MAG: CRISPR-associated protein Cas5 [Peptococcaceae bacterium BRH_c23]KJS89786.1 MAG: CRISPR-associated protein Cas5 [Desulfosporosinus sp. BICA1-9]